MIENKEMNTAIDLSEDVQYLKRNIVKSRKLFIAELAKKWKLFKLAEYIRESYSDLRNVSGYTCKLSGANHLGNSDDGNRSWPMYVYFYSEKELIFTYKIRYYLNSEENLEKYVRRGYIEDISGYVEDISIKNENLIVAFNIVKLFARKIKEFMQAKKQDLLEEQDEERLKQDYLAAIEDIEI